jgi:hypothetical protein
VAEPQRRPKEVGMTWQIPTAESSVTERVLRGPRRKLVGESDAWV